MEHSPIRVSFTLNSNKSQKQQFRGLAIIFSTSIKVSDTDDMPTLWHIGHHYTRRKTQVLRGMVSAFGLSEQVVSDNGPQLMSHKLSNFMKLNKIKHTVTTPYHHTSNVLYNNEAGTPKQVES